MMATLERTTCQFSPADLRPQDVMVAFVIERFKQMSAETYADIFTLLKEITDPQTSERDQQEIFSTIREILFPELIGELQAGPLGFDGPVPERVQKRTDHVSKKIKQKREEQRLTQAQLAEKSGLQQSHICRLESGKHSPSYKTLEKIASALGITIGDLDPSH